MQRHLELEVFIRMLLLRISTSLSNQFQTARSGAARPLNKLAQGNDQWCHHDERHTLVYES